MNLKNKYKLGFFPTPLHKLENLSKKYSNYNIYIKRDDNTGLASGGNKTRKLEYLIQNAIDNGCDTIITAGAQQSNHCRQTVAACNIAGLKCCLMLGGEQPLKNEGNLLLSNLLGAEIHFTGNDRKGKSMVKLKQKLENEGKKPYIIPYGGSNLIGAMGYINAVNELKQQLENQKIKIDYIFYASSSGGMQAGITLGKEIYSLNSELCAVSIDKNETNGLTLQQSVLNIVNEGTRLFSLKKQFALDEIEVIKKYDEPGYGVITQNEKKAIHLLAKNEGIILDPVYTGRAFYGMIDFIEKNKIKKGSNILFWHTGGLPANFFYSKEIL